jgi:very-short-patch-repair endonuclease
MASLQKPTPPGRFAATLPIEGREGGSGGPARPRREQHTPKAKELSKRLRKELTGPEAKLWAHLKRIKTVDRHFRKQAAVGPYVVDFACMRSRLIIEVDGEQHGFDRRRRDDLRRTQFLEAHGFRVLRFWNEEVLKEIDDVLDTIYAALHGNGDPASASKAGHPLRPFGPPPPSRGRRTETLAPSTAGQSAENLTLLPPLDGEGAPRSGAGGVALPEASWRRA